MSNGIDLLKLLEPVVRPGGQSAPKSQPADPIESRSFDSILADAQSIAEQPATKFNSSSSIDEASTSDASEKPPLQSSLRPLADVSQIENAALRRMLAQSISVDTSNHKV